MTRPRGDREEVRRNLAIDLQKQPQSCQPDDGHPVAEASN